MRLIITGGSGLIGQALTNSLAADGHEIIILSRSPAKVSGSLPPQARAIQWDGRTVAASWAELVNETEAIINLAGAGIADRRWTPQRKQYLRESRLQPGQAVLQAIQLAAHKPQLLIQASAVGYYGPGGSQVLTEQAPPGDDFVAQLCRDWEASTAPVEEMGVRRAVIRTGLVLSPQGGLLARLLLPFKLFVGGPVGSGQQYYPWIHIADEVAAIRYLVEHPTAGGPFNLAAPNPVTNAAFSRALGRALSRPAVMPIPAFALRLLFGQLANALLTGQRAIPRRLQQLGYPFRFTHLEPALEELV